LADYFADLLSFNFPQALTNRQLDRTAEPAPEAFTSPDGNAGTTRLYSLSRAEYRAAAAIADPKERKAVLLRMAGYDEAEIAELLRGSDRTPARARKAQGGTTASGEEELTWLTSRHCCPGPASVARVRLGCGNVRTIRMSARSPIRSL
jgi:hypothetical protein